MPNPMDGGLNAVSSMVNTAGGGDPTLTDMVKRTMQRSDEDYDYLTAQRAARNAEMDRYAQMVRDSQQPGANEALMWGSMAQAASRVAPTWGNIGTMLGQVGGAYGNFRASEQAENLKNQADITKLRQAEVRALESKNQNAAMLRAMSVKNSGSFEFRKNSDGTTSVFSKSTGLPVGTYGPQDIGKVSSLAQTLAKAAFDKGDYATLDEAMSWATSEALRQVGAMNTAAGNRTSPLTGEVGGIPTTEEKTPKGEGIAPQISEKVPGGVSLGGDLPSMLSPADAELANRLITRINSNPSAAANDIKRLESILGKYRNTSPLQAAAESRPAPTSMPKRSQEEEERGKARGREMGKAEGERSGALPEEINRVEQATSKLDSWRDLAMEALTHPGLSKTVGAEGYIPGRGRVATVAGTDSANFQALMKPLLSKAAFGELQAMREASKTGGALGNVTEKELEMLQNSVAAMSLEQDPDQFKKELTRIVKHVDRIKSEIAKAHGNKYGKQGFAIKAKEQPVSNDGFSIKLKE